MVALIILEYPMDMAINNKGVIIPGLEEPLSAIEDHADVDGITRFLLLNNRMIAGKSFHIASHQIDEAYDPSQHGGQTNAHKHSCDEINLLLSNDGNLIYEYEIDGVMSNVKAPACVYLPAGVMHRSKAISGQGTFICMKFDQES